MNDVLEQIALTNPRFAPATARHGKRHGWWQRLVLRWQIMRENRATRRALEQLDDRMLKDIGLGANDIWLRSRSGEMPSSRFDR